MNENDNILCSQSVTVHATQSEKKNAEWIEQLRCDQPPSMHDCTLYISFRLTYPLFLDLIGTVEFHSAPEEDHLRHCDRRTVTIPFCSPIIWRKKKNEKSIKYINWLLMELSEEFRSFFDNSLSMSTTLLTMRLFHYLLLSASVWMHWHMFLFHVSYNSRQICLHFKLFRCLAAVINVEQIIINNRSVFFFFFFGNSFEWNGTIFIHVRHDVGNCFVDWWMKCTSLNRLGG